MATLFRSLSPETPLRGARPTMSAGWRLPWRLQRQALGHAGWHAVGLICVYLGLRESYPPQTALRWLLQAALVLAVVHGQLWRFLGDNRRPSDGRRLSRLGIANAITLARAWAIAVLAGCLGWSASWTAGRWAGMAWAPGLLYLAVGAADFVDGFWARRTGTESVLGQRLDMEMDALGLLAAVVLAVDLGRLPPFYLSVGGIYYLFRLGLWCRHRAGKTTKSVRERPFGRLTAGLQMGFVGSALLPCFAPRILHFAAASFLIPLVIGFIWDWMVVCGRLSRNMDRRWRSALRRAGDIAASGVRLILLAAGPFAAGALFPALSRVEAVGLAVLWLSMVLGLMGRSAALGALLLLAHGLPGGDPPRSCLLALQLSLALLIIGTGRWSWWRPEDRFFFRKIGTPFRTEKPVVTICPRDSWSVLITAAASPVFDRTIQDPQKRPTLTRAARFMRPRQPALDSVETASAHAKGG